ncbi:hypothetical protein HK22_02085 [Gluconobacter sp. DsW_056]|uniref:hypothetical protein n=1 Tax=Gluconobacter sp. DsW_056 TaxID=1511209 RepID=UPI000A3D5998|nr:hypothetical protein [Gluconobacter sp. DsW_056]OUI81669.1 hypothetical protein HK22_02085 [Gluconobacter sp. DsW_056]
MTAVTGRFYLGGINVDTLRLVEQPASTNWVIQNFVTDAPTIFQAVGNNPFVCNFEGIIPVSTGGMIGLAIDLLLSDSPFSMRDHIEKLLAKPSLITLKHPDRGNFDGVLKNLEVTNSVEDRENIYIRGTFIGNKSGTAVSGIGLSLVSSVVSQTMSGTGFGVVADAYTQSMSLTSASLGQKISSIAGVASSFTSGIKSTLPSLVTGGAIKIASLSGIDDMLGSGWTLGRYLQDNSVSDIVKGTIDTTNLSTTGIINAVADKQITNQQENLATLETKLTQI